MRYSPERKDAVLRKMMPPHNRSIKQLAQEEGISEATLFAWRKQARDKGLLLPDGDSGPEGWSARDKFAAVLETATFNETELAEYCRSKGIYPEQLSQRRKACKQANDRDKESNRRLKTEKNPIASGSANWNMNCGARKKRWQKRQPCWSGKK